MGGDRLRGALRHAACALLRRATAWPCATAWPALPPGRVRGCCQLGAVARYELTFAARHNTGCGHALEDARTTVVMVSECEGLAQSRLGCGPGCVRRKDATSALRDVGRGVDRAAAPVQPRGRPAHHLAVIAAATSVKEAAGCRLLLQASRRPQSMRTAACVCSNVHACRQLIRSRAGLSKQVPRSRNGLQPVSAQAALSYIRAGSRQPCRACNHGSLHRLPSPQPRAPAPVQSTQLHSHPVSLTQGTQLAPSTLAKTIATYDFY